MFDLNELYGSKVRVTLDESWFKPWPNIDCRKRGSPRLPAKTQEDKLWCYEIVGARGKIYPQSECTVCVSTTKRIGTKLLNIFKPKASLLQRGDNEYSVEIPLNLVESTFRYIKPKQRRQLTEEQKRVLTDRLKATRPAEKRGF